MVTSGLAYRLGVAPIRAAMRCHSRPCGATSAPARGLPRAGLRIYLGTIPDYTNSAQTTGLALSGVAKGGPAESAGVRAGDVVIQVAGRTIENLYDYTYSLDELGALSRTVTGRARPTGRASNPPASPSTSASWSWHR